MTLSQQICLELDKNPKLVDATPSKINGKIKRYSNSEGLPVAAETDYANIWCLERHGSKFSHAGIEAISYPAPTRDKFGRHSGLKIIPEFLLEPAICFKLTSLEQFRKIAIFLAG